MEEFGLRADTPLYHDVNIPCRPGEIASSKQPCNKDLTTPRSADKAVPIRGERGKAINSTAISLSVIN